jgi:hypothetical protein
VSSPAFAEPLLEPFSLGGGFQDLATIAAPGNGNAAVQAIGRRFRTRVLSAFFSLVTDANVANRTVVVQFEDSAGTVLAATAAAVQQAAAQTVAYSFALGLLPGGAIASGVVTGPLPALFLEPSRKVRVRAAGMQAGDHFSNVVLVVEQFSTDPAGAREQDRRRRRG